MTRTIKYTVRFNTSPVDVYETLMDSKRHEAFTGQPANIENREGGKFTCYGNSLSGKTLTLIPNKKIVQKWRAKDWEKNVFSEVTYTLSQDGNDTVLTFLQTGVPDSEYDKINQGWEMAYWKPMKTYFAK